MGRPFRKRTEVEAVFVLQAVVHLAADREEVGRVGACESRGSARWPAEVSELELTAVALDPLAQHVQCAALLDLRRQPLEQPVLGLLRPCSFLNFSHSLGWVA